MINVFPYLQQIKEKINELNYFKCVKIGLEKGADKAINCPFARVILEEEETRGVFTNAIVQIVIVFDTKNDLEKLYEQFLDVAVKIKKKMFELPVKVEILNTFHDEDRLVNLKAAVIRLKLLNLIEAQ